MLVALREKIGVERIALKEGLDERQIGEVADDRPVAADDQLLGIVATESPRFHLPLEEAARPLHQRLQRGAEIELEVIAALGELPTNQGDEIGVLREEVEGHRKHPVDLRPAILGIGDGLLDPLEPVSRERLEDLLIEGLLARKVMEQARSADADGGGDVVQGRAGVAVRREAPKGLGQDEIPRRHVRRSRHWRPRLPASVPLRGMSTDRSVGVIVAIMRLLAARVVVPGSVLAPGFVDIDESNGTIAAVGRHDGPAPDRTLTPGFIDIQCNGMGELYCGTADGDEWSTLGRAALAGGVTSWFPTIVTAPLPDYGPAIERVEAAANVANAVGSGLPAIAGVHLEGPFLGGAPRRPSA